MDSSGTSLDYRKCIKRHSIIVHDLQLTALPYLASARRSRTHSAASADRLQSLSIVYASLAMLYGKVF